MKKILEIGCGFGFKGSYLSKRGDYVGIDIDTNNIKVAKKRYPFAKYISANAEKLPFLGSSFDEIYAIEVLEHVNNLNQVLNEMTRVIKPGGKIILSFPHIRSERWLTKLRPTYFKEIHHVRIINQNKLIKQLSQLGFTLQKCKNTGFIAHIELYFLFTRKNIQKSQTSIGSWRDNYFLIVLHVCLLFLSVEIFHTPLKIVPIWIITIPLGLIIDNIGSRFFPKTVYMELKYEKK